MTSSWLIRNDTDRQRMLDMDRRLRPGRQRSFAVLAAALLICGPWLGWWTLGPLVVAALLFYVADRHMSGLHRPEYLAFAAWAAAALIIAICVALSGGPKIATTSWLAIPTVTLAARFSKRGVVAGVAFTLVLLLAIALGVDPQATLANPTIVVAPAALIVAVAMLSVALMESDIEHRSRAVLDELTGALNRTALTSRVEELEQQSAVTGAPVGLVLADVDHFKQVNDVHGHVTGDAVLRDFAYLMRKELRAFDLIYRLGGEEFLVLLPGASTDQAWAIAEQLRRAIDGCLLAGGVDVTISCGVAASVPGSLFVCDMVFAAADAALYEAKRTGRNRVSSAAASPQLQPVAAG